MAPTCGGRRLQGHRILCGVQGSERGGGGLEGPEETVPQPRGAGGGAARREGDRRMGEGLQTNLKFNLYMLPVYMQAMCYYLARLHIG